MGPPNMSNTGANPNPRIVRQWPAHGNPIECVSDTDAQNIANHGSLGAGPQRTVQMIQTPISRPNSEFSEARLVTSGGILQLERLTGIDQKGNEIWMRDTTYPPRELEKKLQALKRHPNQALKGGGNELRLRLKRKQDEPHPESTHSSELGILESRYDALPSGELRWDRSPKGPNRRQRKRDVVTRRQDAQIQNELKANPELQAEILRKARENKPEVASEQGQRQHPSAGSNVESHSVVSEGVSYAPTAPNNDALDRKMAALDQQIAEIGEQLHASAQQTVEGQDRPIAHETLPANPALDESKQRLVAGKTEQQVVHSSPQPSAASPGVKPSNPQAAALIAELKEKLKQLNQLKQRTQQVDQPSDAVSSAGSPAGASPPTTLKPEGSSLPQPRPTPPSASNRFHSHSFANLGVEPKNWLKRFKSTLRSLKSSSNTASATVNQPAVAALHDAVQGGKAPLTPASYNKARGMLKSAAAGLFEIGLGGAIGLAMAKLLAVLIKKPHAHNPNADTDEGITANTEIALSDQLTEAIDLQNTSDLQDLVWMDPSLREGIEEILNVLPEEVRAEAILEFKTSLSTCDPSDRIGFATVFGNALVKDYADHLAASDGVVIGDMGVQGLRREVFDQLWDSNLKLAQGSVGSSQPTEPSPPTLHPVTQSASQTADFAVDNLPVMGAFLGSGLAMANVWRQVTRRRQAASIEKQLPVLAKFVGSGLAISNLWGRAVQKADSSAEARNVVQLAEALKPKVADQPGTSPAQASVKR